MSIRSTSALLVCATFLAFAWPGPSNAQAGESVSAAIEHGDYAAAEALLRARIAESPSDAEARFTLARVLAYSGNYEAALAEYEALLAEHPRNVDYVFGRALVLYWAGDDAGALAALERARALAPGYEDVWRQEHVILLRRPGSAARLASLREEAARRFPHAGWWKETAQASVADGSTEVSFGAMHQSLSTDAPDWRNLFVRVTRRPDARTTFYAAISGEERFARTDLVAAGGVGWRLSQQWSAGFDLGMGVDADFMPKATATAWAGQALAGGWETQYRLRLRDYGQVEVASTAFTLARYFGSFRAAYTLDLSRLEGDRTSAGHIATLSYYASERTQLDLTLAEGEESEAIGPDQVLRTDVRGFSIGLRHALTDRWRLSGWLGSHRQGDIYTRRYVGLSLATGL